MDARHHGKRAVSISGLADPYQEDDDRHRQERERVRHHRRPGEVSEVAAEAEGDRGHGEQVRGQHQPAREEADPRSERERGVLELGRVLRPHRTESGVRMGGQAGGDGGQEKGEPPYGWRRIRRPSLRRRG